QGAAGRAPGRDQCRARQEDHRRVRPQRDVGRRPRRRRAEDREGCEGRGVMIARRSSGNDSSPPPERGRSASKARRVGVMQPSRFDRTGLKTLRARNLRRNFTDVEMKVWQKLRNRQLGVDFRRQHPAGSYVLDFYAPSVRLAVELDGEQHAQATTIASDRSRTRWLEERGVTMLRFWNSDVV